MNECRKVSNYKVTYVTDFSFKIRKSHFNILKTKTLIYDLKIYVLTFF